MNVRAAIAAAALLAVAACSREENLVPPDWGLNRMTRQPRYDAYGGSSFFEDGRAMQLPPDGAVPVNAELGPAAMGIEPGSHLMTIPLPLTSALLARGRDRFETFCAPCHGVAGDGVSIVAAAMPLVKPPSLVTRAMAQEPPGHVYHVIVLGFGMMPRYGYQLPEEDRWATVAYVRALQLAAAAELSVLPPELQDRALRELSR